MMMRPFLVRCHRCASTLQQSGSTFGAAVLAASQILETCAALPSGHAAMPASPILIGACGRALLPACRCQTGSAVLLNPRALHAVDAKALEA